MQTIDPRVTAWRAKYSETLQLAHGWDVNVLFNQGCQELTEELTVLATSGAVAPEAIGIMAGYLKALLDTQERWLLREAAMIEAAGAIRQ